jgi:hypothetical protein
MVVSVSTSGHKPERCPFGHQLRPGMTQVGRKPCMCSAARKELDSRALWCLELAKLHTASAQVAATALNCGGRCESSKARPARTAEPVRS